MIVTILLIVLSSIVLGVAIDERMFILAGVQIALVILNVLVLVGV